MFAKSLIVVAFISVVGGMSVQDNAKEVAGWKAYGRAVQSHAYQKTGRLLRAPEPKWERQLEAVDAAMKDVSGTSAEVPLEFTRAGTLFAMDRFVDALATLEALKAKHPRHGLCALTSASDSGTTSLVDAAIADCRSEIDIRKTITIRRLPEAVLDTGEKALVHTSRGDFEIQFYKSAAPETVANFKKLCMSGYFNDTYVHRVAPLQRIEAGCPNTKPGNRQRTDDGFGSPGYDLALELNSATHIGGAVSMLRIPGSDRSHGCQFSICVADQPELNGQQAVFGTVIAGIDIIKRMTQERADDEDNPYEHLWIRGIEWLMED